MEEQEQFKKNCFFILKLKKKVHYLIFYKAYIFLKKNKNKANKLYLRTLFKDVHGKTYADKTQEIQMWK